MFCHDCLELGRDPALFSPDFNRTLKASFPDCEAAAAQGCQLCLLIKQKYDGPDNQERRDLIPDQPLKVYRGPNHDLSELAVDVASACFGVTTWHLDIYTPVDDVEASDPRVTGRSIAAHSGARECLDRVAKLLRVCIESHSTCLASPEAAFLPARVLDLGPMGNSPIRLFCTGRTFEAPYVTLSHCWGKPSASRPILKQDNLADMIRGIPYDRLTPVFQDAVTVTRHLGIRYLWIDALCIIQDSKLDWAEESVRMGDIYQHATLNVASACSPDGYTPFLRPRPAHDPEFNLPLPNGRKIGLRHRYQDAKVISSHLIQPLQSRAWCFQERVLSTRTVFFDDLQFLWECRAGHQPEKEGRLAKLTRYSESFRGANRSMEPYVKPNFHSAPDPSPNICGSSLPSDEEERLEGIFQHWYQLLYEYCIRSLTYFDDSLPALSAIAKYYRRVTGDTYLAGIWQKDIHRGLVWSCSLRHDGDVRRNPGSPSWSWASLLGDSVNFEVSVVSHIRTHRRPLKDKDATLIKTELVPLLGDTEGQMRSAALHLRGLGRPVTLLNHHEIDNGLGEHEPLHLLEPASGLSAWAHLDPDTIKEENERRRQGCNEPTAYVAFLLGQWDRIYHDTSAYIRGLLLAPTGVDGQFVRKGIWAMQPPLRDPAELAAVNTHGGHLKVDPRKKTFDGTWDGWAERSVVVI
ncbi:heterokaryon incompatibility protein-domain-containing protein [Immersiella caudata]|uniref:Heterokaryon incompatibility protein-domain-containing protein n=1 Tax=Immersiella caudata TaxID=314043 RepID=A0AA39WWX0_9PEZI|nr:heterokaryon incompatibility protein-domain-containing protein [Immersiella caudata]